VLLLIDTVAGRLGLRVDDVLDMVEVDPARRRALPATGGAMTAMLEDVIDLGDGIAGAVAMDALRAAMAARLTTEAA
jgi:chemotaxis signal transduction protein